MGRPRRVVLKLALVSALVAALFVASASVPGLSGLSQVAHAAPSCVSPCTSTFYGTNGTKLTQAMANLWPQLGGPYCGIATIMVIANYTDIEGGVALQFNSQGQQESVVASANRTVSSYQSQWGYQLAGGNNVGGYTNISLDYGTDPRSIAQMAWRYTASGVYMHDYIYRWQFSNLQTGEPLHWYQSEQATTNLARTFQHWEEPLSVTINNGKHSVLVTGICAFNDPSQNYPADIDSIVYRDPQTNNLYQVPFSTWDQGGYYEPGAGTYSLWSGFYGDNNPGDPEPAVGPYAPRRGVGRCIGFTASRGSSATAIRRGTIGTRIGRSRRPM